MFSLKDINETGEEKLLLKLNTFLFAASKLSISTWVQIISGIRPLNIVIECELNGYWGGAFQNTEI